MVKNADGIKVEYEGRATLSDDILNILQCSSTYRREQLLSMPIS
jgi:hypothetical protein